jgi:hypothetical protein
MLGMGVVYRYCTSLIISLFLLFLFLLLLLLLLLLFFLLGLAGLFPAFVVECHEVLVEGVIG